MAAIAAVVCYVVAGLLFLLAGFNQTLFSQPELDEIAFGLFFLVLAGVLSWVGPPLFLRRPPG